MKRKHLLEKIKSLGGFHVEDLKSKLVSTIMDSLSDEQSKDINHVKIQQPINVHKIVMLKLTNYY